MVLIRQVQCVARLERELFKGLIPIDRFAQIENTDAGAGFEEAPIILASADIENLSIRRYSKFTFEPRHSSLSEVPEKDLIDVMNVHQHFASYAIGRAVVLRKLDIAAQGIYN